MLAPILVIGGGIGGVATALALGRQGRPVRLFEQADQIGAIGYGVQMGPNVMPMLERLGVGDAVRAAAYLPPELLLYDLATGVKLEDIPLRTAAFSERYAGRPYTAIHRVDLHELLLAACASVPSIEMVPDTTVTAYQNTGTGAGISSAAGERFEGAAVIAADGLRSRLRAQMHPHDALLAAMKGLSFESPRGPVTLDRQTRDLTQNIYLRKVTKVNGQPWNVEFETVRQVSNTGVKE